MKVKPIEPATTPTPADSFTVTENEDGSVTFPLSDGMSVTLRDPLTEDMLAMEQFALRNEGVTDSAGVLKLVSLMCTQWGGQDGVSYQELTQIPFRKFKPNLRRLAYVLKEFFRLEDLLSSE